MIEQAIGEHEAMGEFAQGVASFLPAGEDVSTIIPALSSLALDVVVLFCNAAFFRARY
jgi:hypothetical protein